MENKIIPKMLNDEVEEYLTRNDIVIVQSGTVEMQGDFLWIRKRLSVKLFALKMAEACDGLCINWSSIFLCRSDCKWKRNGSGQHSGRNSLSDRNCGKSFLRQGFKKTDLYQCTWSMHMTVSPMVRDFMDKTGTPILYMDMIMQLMRNGQDVLNLQIHSMQLRWALI